MNKFPVTDLQNYLEENSQYRRLLEDRFINEQRYLQNLAAVQQGLSFLGMPGDSIKVFQGRTNFIVWLGNPDLEFKGCELPMYIGYKKANLPIPDNLLEKCPRQIISLLDQVSPRQYITEFQNELKEVSFSVELFLVVHKSIMSARAENLLPNLMGDIERMAFTNIKDAIKRIPSIYANYLSPESFMKMVKKISANLRNLKVKLDEELKSIDLYSLRLREQINELYIETTDSLRSIVENEVEKGGDISLITQKISNLFSRLDRLFLGNIYHLRDYQKRCKEIQQILKQEDESLINADNQALNKWKKISELYEEYLFSHQFGPLTKEEDKLFAKLLVKEFEQCYRQKSPDLQLLGKFEKKGLLSVQLEFNLVKDAYYNFMKSAVIPQYVGTCLLDMVSYLPPEKNEPSRVITDFGNLKILALEGKDILNVVKARTYSKPLANFVETYRKCVTLLIYDIRGSSYMGIKLHNAAKEQKIKYKFAKEMAEIVRKYDGFLLKDTGDGGLVWFSENSGSLYKHLYTESLTGRGMQLRHSIFSGAEFDLIPAFDGAKRAILCARDMIKRAEEFIQANFMHYREWFVDITERTLELDGITYALLPPEFKSMFRIGIGIASGIPDKDVVLAANSYGDPDMVGPIIADAHLYATERQPGRSVIICDLSSLINLILNIENFEYPIDEKDFEKYLQSVETIRKGERGYRFSDHKISIVPKGIHVLDELDKKKTFTDTKIAELLIDENNNLYNDRKRKIKPIYEILEG